jgi:hypothetical protein
MAELIKNYDFYIVETNEKLRTKEYFFPYRLYERLHGKKGQDKLTISTDPEEGAVLLPFPECVPIDEPRRGAIMLNLTCCIMVDGRIRRRAPRWLYHLRQTEACKNRIW